MISNQKICLRCVMDTTVSGIEFDEKDECNYCKLHDKHDEKYPLCGLGQQKLSQLVDKIKRDGKNNKYGCVVGASGGTDSTYCTYCLYLVKKWGLRPLAVHLDNGWDTDIAINNFRKATEKLGIDLKILEVDWDEFKEAMNIAKRIANWAIENI